MSRTPKKGPPVYFDEISPGDMLPNIRTKSHKKRIIPGQRIGRLIVASFSGFWDSNQNKLWTCNCDCGNTTDVSTAVFNQGSKKSCGCLQQEKMPEAIAAQRAKKDAS